jgi:hypothetical protein
LCRLNTGHKRRVRLQGYKGMAAGCKGAAAVLQKHGGGAAKAGGGAH